MYFEVRYRPVQETTSKPATMAISQQAVKYLNNLERNDISVSRLTSISVVKEIPTFEVLLREIIPNSREILWTVVARVTFEDDTGEYKYLFAKSASKEVRKAAKQWVEKNGLSFQLSTALTEVKNQDRAKSSARRKDLSQTSWVKRTKYKRSTHCDFHKPIAVTPQSRHRNKGKLWLEIDRDELFQVFIYLCHYENQIVRRTKVAHLYLGEDGNTHCQYRTSDVEIQEHVFNWLSKLQYKRLAEHEIFSPKHVIERRKKTFKPDKRTRQANRANRERVKTTKSIAIEIPGQNKVGVKINYQDINEGRLMFSGDIKTPRLATGYKGGIRDI